MLDNGEQYVATRWRNVSAMSYDIFFLLQSNCNDHLQIGCVCLVAVSIQTYDNVYLEMKEIQIV